MPRMTRRAALCLLLGVPAAEPHVSTRPCVTPRNQMILDYNDMQHALAPWAEEMRRTVPTGWSVKEKALWRFIPELVARFLKSHERYKRWVDDPESY